MQTSCLSSLFSVLQEVTENKMLLCTMMADNGLKNLQRSDTKCWGQGRQCGSASNIRDEEEPVYAHKQDRHTESEREI